jgi:DNA-binding PadR family transcriptional regulator
MTTSDEITENLPLTEATFFILLSLSSGKKHGYVIMKDVDELSNRRITLSTGTLYGALRRLLEREWIERVEEEQEGGRLRKAYVLSALGRRILRAESERLTMLVSAAKLRLVEIKRD